MVARVIKGSGRVKDGLLGKIEDFGNVKRKLCRAFNARLNFL